MEKKKQTNKQNEFEQKNSKNRKAARRALRLSVRTWAVAAAASAVW